MKKQLLITLSLSALIAACSEIPKQAYYNRGQPEALLNVSSEEQIVDLNQRNGLQQLTQVVNRHQPTSAELSCSNRLLCTRATEVLNQYKVPFKQNNDGGNSVTLNFRSIQARDCENRYIDNHINPYNLNHPTFGCSIAVNQVQMVSNKGQFVDPILLGSYDGEKATQNYDTYLSRQTIPLEIISSTGSGSSGGGGR